MRDDALVLLPRIRVIASREIRLVPLTWQHPLDAYGEATPLLPEQMPDISHLPDAKIGMAVYETTTEGTPCTPTFPRTAEGLNALIDYCAAHVSLFAFRMGSRDQWERLLCQKELVTVEMAKVEV
jgi:hypothetical protein